MSSFQEKKSQGKKKYGPLKEKKYKQKLAYLLDKDFNIIILKVLEKKSLKEDEEKVRKTMCECIGNSDKEKTQKETTKKLWR